MTPEEMISKIRLGAELTRTTTEYEAGAAAAVSWSLDGVEIGHLHVPSHYTDSNCNVYFKTNEGVTTPSHDYGIEPNERLDVRVCLENYIKTKSK